MMESIVKCIILKHYFKAPDKIERFSTGTGNYVYYLEWDDTAFVLRLSENSYEDTVGWLTELRAIGIPVQEIQAYGQWEEWHYLILSYLPGQELNVMYPTLSTAEKKSIAQEVLEIQKKASTLVVAQVDSLENWVEEMLRRARERIEKNGFFDGSRVDAVLQLSKQFSAYFQQLIPVPYLDDITTKNLLVHEGHVSGVIDVDWMGYGDPLTFAALTYVALRNLDYDTEYIDFLLEEMKLSDEELRAFWFYALLYCVDFMGERGSTFNGRTVPVSDEIIRRLNSLYDEIMNKIR